MAAPSLTRGTWWGAGVAVMPGDWNQSNGPIDSSPLYSRDDDRPETVRRRLQVYHEQTEPLLAFYRQRGLFASLDAEGDVEDNYQALLALVHPQVRR